MIDTKPRRLTLGSFPSDGIERVIVGLGPVMFLAGKTDDVRWGVTLRDVGGSEITQCSVTAQLLKVLRLNSTWLNGKCTGTYRDLETFEFQIIQDSDQTIWRKDVGCDDRKVFSYHRSIEHVVPYSLFRGFLHNESIDVLLRQSGSLRFHIGRSPRLSKHLFDFTAPDKNDHLFKAIFQHATQEHVTIGAFTNRLLRDLDKREIAKFISDSYGGHQISRCASKARVTHRNGFAVWPTMGIPHNFPSLMQVSGQRGFISLEDGRETRSVDVLAVTEILNDDFKPVMTELHEIQPKTISTQTTKRVVVKIRPEEFPLDPVVDVDEESAAEWDMLYELDDDTDAEIEGSSNIKIIQKNIKESDIPKDSLVILAGKLGEKTSTTSSPGGDRGVGSGEISGGDDVKKELSGEVEPVAEEELDPFRPRLMDCDPQFLIEPRSIEKVHRDKIPQILHFLVDGILGASNIKGTTRHYRFYGDGGSLPNVASIPLINFDKGLGDCSLMPTSPTGLRRAVIAEVQSEIGVTYYMDVERRADKKESVGINCMTFIGRTSVNSSILAYVLEHRVFPSVGEGSWPTRITHKGEFYQIVRKHVSYKDIKRIAGLKIIERQRQHELRVKNGYR